MTLPSAPYTLASDLRGIISFGERTLGGGLALKALDGALHEGRNLRDALTLTRSYLTDCETDGDVEAPLWIALIDAAYPPLCPVCGGKGRVYAGPRPTIPEFAMSSAESERWSRRLFVEGPFASCTACAPARQEAA